MLEQATATIHRILENHDIEIVQVFLFGSRAYGNAQPNSDWDLYIIVQQALSFPERRSYTTEIKRALARLRIPNNIILKSSEQFEATKSFSGHLAHTVATEGVPV